MLYDFAVQLTRYQSTDAHFVMGVNPLSGVLYFVTRDSPYHAAKILLKREPIHEELLLYRASSDIAFGFWIRAHQGRDASKINMIISVNVIIQRLKISSKWCCGICGMVLQLQHLKIHRNGRVFR